MSSEETRAVILTRLLNHYREFEKELLEYYEPARKFYDEWSKLTTSGVGFGLLKQYYRYGNFLFNYTFEDEIPPPIEKRVGLFTYYLVRKRLPECETREQRILGIIFLFLRLEEEFPRNKMNLAFAIPKHKSISPEKKAEMEEWKKQILQSLEKIQFRLDLLGSLLDKFRNLTNPSVSSFESVDTLVKTE
jgi:hypothetical protein